MANRFLIVPALVALLIGCNAETAVRRPSSSLESLARDGSLQVPGRAQIAALPATVVPGPQRLRWSMWWGENGRRWQVLVNGRLVAGGDLRVLSRRQQQGSVALDLDAPGRYEIRVALCNDHGCSLSGPARVQVVPG